METTEQRINRPCFDDCIKTLKPDAFAELPGVTRAHPGTAVCATCGKPLPYIRVGNTWKPVTRTK